AVRRYAFASASNGDPAATASGTRSAASRRSRTCRSNSASTFMPGIPRFQHWNADSRACQRLVMQSTHRRLRSCITPAMKLPRVVTLFGPAFDRACADLMRLVEADYAPTLIIGIRTGGFSVAQAMAAAASPDIPVLPLTCRRATPAAKSRLPLLRTILGALPRSMVDLLRQMEHRFVTPGHTGDGRRQEIDAAEVAAIAEHLESLHDAPRLLVADDAVDSGTTLSIVL